MKTKFMAIFMAVVVTVITGCFHYKTLIPPSALVTSDPGPMDVLMNDGTIYQLDYASVSLDNVAGHGYIYPIAGPKEYFSGSIPISDITIVQTSRPDKFASLLAIGAIGVLVVASGRASGESDGLEGTASIHYPSSGGDGYWGSCPFVFTFDGNDYRFESETFAGAVCRGLEHANLEPLRYLKPDRGSYRLALANQLKESEHANEVSLLAVDHPYGTRVVPDCSGRIHTIRDPKAPLSAIAYSGTDILDLVTEADDRLSGDDAQPPDPQLGDKISDGMLCDFERAGNAGQAKLVIDMRNTNLGYFALEKIFSLEGPNRLTFYHKLNSDSNERQKLMGWILREGALHVWLMVDGQWVLQEAVPPVGSRTTAEKVVLIDLNRVKGDRIKIKLESADDLWLIDRLAIDYSPDEQFTILTPELTEAVTQKGRNVAGLISAPDSLYYSMLPGDYALLSFGEVPENSDYARSYLLKTQGFYYTWIKPGDQYDSTLVERILTEPQYGNRLFLPEWRKLKSRYSEADHTPHFELKTQPYSGSIRP
jgi:hypothetical protein